MHNATRARAREDRRVARKGAGLAKLTPDLVSEMTRHKAALLALLMPVTGFVTLKRGVSVPRPAFDLVHDLEARGFALSVDACHQVVIQPAENLTEADRAGIGRWRLHLGALVSYTCEVVG